jgi:hypothetical protein
MYAPAENKSDDTKSSFYEELQRHSNTVDVRSFGGFDRDTDHYLVAAEVTEGLSVSKHGKI